MHHNCLWLPAHRASLACFVQLAVQTVQQLQQQLGEATSKLREYAAADGLIERAITTAANAGEQSCKRIIAQPIPTISTCCVPAIKAGGQAS